MAYKISNTVFVGDTLFMPDVGTARCDFPGGDAHQLYRSIHKLLSLPANTVLYICHDYPPPGREPIWQTSVSEQRRANIHVHDGVSEAETDPTLSKDHYKRLEGKLHTALLKAQYDRLQRADQSLLIVVAGIDCAGKGDTINLLNQWMDPCHIHTLAFGPLTQEECDPPAHVALLE